MLGEKPDRHGRRLGGYLLLLGLLWSVPCSQALADGLAVLKSHDLEPFNQALAGFLAACPQRVAEFDLRGSRKEERSIVPRLLAAKPRMLLAIGPLAAQVARERLRHIPMIFVMVSNPAKYGLAGDHVRGVSLDIPVRTQLAMYKTLVPGLQTLGVIYDPDKTGAIVAEAQQVATTLGLQLLTSSALSHKDVPAALRGLLGKIDALWMVPDDTVVTPESFKFQLLAAFENNLPFVTVSDVFVQEGALASFAPDYADVGRQGCQLLTEIERGQHSAEELVLPPAKVNMALNLKTAGKIGLVLPAEVIQAASNIYR